MAKHIVYRYIDCMDGIVKYVGITSRALSQRVKEHETQDSWVQTTKGWEIDYFYVDTKSQSEAWESHLIATYKTYEWFNKAKSTWGVIREFNRITPQWKVYSSGDDIIDIHYEYYPTIEDTKGLITDNYLAYTFDTTTLEIHRLVSKRVIQPLAKTKTNALLFMEEDEQKAYDYFHH